MCLDWPVTQLLCLFRGNLTSHIPSSSAILESSECYISSTFLHSFYSSPYCTSVPPFSWLIHLLLGLPVGLFAIVFLLKALFGSLLLQYLFILFDWNHYNLFFSTNVLHLLSLPHYGRKYTINLGDCLIGRYIQQGHSHWYCHSMREGPLRILKMMANWGRYKMLCMPNNGGEPALQLMGHWFHC